MNLLERMAHSIDSMTMGEKFIGSLQVTFLGMSIVFAGLAILYFSIVIMQKIMVKSVGDTGKKHEASSKVEIVETNIVNESDNMELVAIITAAVAASLNTSTNNIVVRNISRVANTTPSWAMVGRVEQINNRL